MPALPDYYDVLGLAEDATQALIKKRYRALALDLHPDQNRAGSTKAFTKIVEAYEVLGNTERRSVYDAGLAAQRTRRPSPRPGAQPAWTPPSPEDVAELDRTIRNGAEAIGELFEAFKRFRNGR